MFPSYKTDDGVYFQKVNLQSLIKLTSVADAEMLPSVLCAYAKQSFALWYVEFRSLTSYLQSQNLNCTLKIVKDVTRNK